MSFDPVSEMEIAHSAVASSVTGTLTETTLFSTTIKANTMKPNEILAGQFVFSYTNSALTKTLRLKLGGVTVANIPVTTTAQIRRWFWMPIVSNTSQIVYPSASTTGIGTSTSAFEDPAVDITTDLTLEFTGQLANIAETIVLEQLYFRQLKQAS